MQRLLYGAILGGVPALVLGIAIGTQPADPCPVRSTDRGDLYSVPKSAILPLALLIFGLGEGSRNSSW